MSQNSLEHLEILLNDYYNSEKNLYLDLKQKLLNGIELNYSGPQIVSIKNENELVSFIQIISNNEINISYQESIMEHNCTLSLFFDDIIQLQFYDNEILMFDKVFSLSSFASFSVTQKFPHLIGKKKDYKVFLKLVKIGEERKFFERKCIDDCDDIAMDFVKELHQAVCGWKTAKSIESNHLMVFHLLKERMKLFNYTVTNEHDLMKALATIQISDLGVKDIVKLSYLMDVFFTHSLNNKQVFEKLEEKILQRKKSYEELCQKIQNLK